MANQRGRPGLTTVFQGRKSTTQQMKGSIVAILLAAMGTPVSAAFVYKEPKPLLARVTVYWASGGKGSDRYTRKHKCATGLRLRDGHCAVDPKQIPYGSHIILPDGTTLSAVDTGTAVRNRKAARLLGKTPTERNALVIDRFFESKNKALAWANSHPHFIPVRVLTPGSSIPRITAEAPVQRAIVVGPTKTHRSDGGLKLPQIH
jgi:3D (Asp-Asp-Asp) domain-containing protein